MIKIGVDIHTYIVKNKEIIGKDLYDGRNSEWFNNLQHGDDIEYEYFQWYKGYGFSEQAPKYLEEKYTNENGYYGFFYINVKDFKDWFNKYNPGLKAGWGSRWDQWAVENKCYIPEYLSHYKNDDDDVFIEYFDEYEPSIRIYEYLMEKDIPDDADLQIFFDC